MIGKHGYRLTVKATGSQSAAVAAEGQGGHCVGVPFQPLLRRAPRLWQKRREPLMMKLPSNIVRV